MNFLGIGGLEFALIFFVAMFFLGPRRLAEGVRSGRKYYRELRKYRAELTGMVKEAIDADELKKEFEETKRDVWDESATRGIKDLDKDLAIDTGALDIPELDITRPIPSEASAAGSSTSDAADAGDVTSKMNEAERPSERSQ